MLEVHCNYKNLSPCLTEKLGFSTINSLLHSLIQLTKCFIFRLFYILSFNSQNFLYLDCPTIEGNPKYISISLLFLALDFTNIFFCSTGLDFLLKNMQDFCIFSIWLDAYLYRPKSSGMFFHSWLYKILYNHMRIKDNLA